MNSIQNYGVLVKRLRLQSGLTQKQLAVLLAVDATYISKIENAQLVVLPSNDLMSKMARALNVDTSILLDAASKIDTIQLRQQANNNPDIAFVLRRIQSGITDEQIAKIKAILEIKDTDNGD